MDQPLSRHRPAVRDMLIVALLCLVVAVAMQPIAADDVTTLAAVFALAWALCLVLAGRNGLYRPTTAYLVLFGLFHGGLLFSVALRGPDAFTAYDSSWLYTGYTADAVRLTILGMAACTLAATLAAGRAGKDDPPERVAPPTAAAAATVGLSVLVAGLGIFAASVAQAGGLDLLSGGYAAFLQANESDGLLGYGTLLIGIGAVLAIIAGGPARIAAWTGFCLYALTAFVIGTRGAVLFPLLALLVVEHRRGHRIRPRWTVLGVPCLLALIGLVRTTRLAVADASASTPWSAPLDAVAEMGYSLRPTVVVYGWHAFGEPFLHGMSLIAVPVRVLEGLTGWHGGPPAHDTRLFNVEISDRVGPIGGSPVAEGYHNAGLAGVLVLMIAIGLVLGWLERRRGTALGDGLAGIVLLPLLIQIRNSFAPVPIQLGIGLAALCLVAAVPRWVSTRRRRS
ncbi:MAG TPA: O-antigen polysaccharide polymerase Wzy [Amycolatopsis sp.]|nr:O-antigen polysaccharide polymerase Wzy [Amycolatopsis sp.]